MSHARAYHKMWRQLRFVQRVQILKLSAVAVQAVYFVIAVFQEFNPVYHERFVQNIVLSENQKTNIESIDYRTYRYLNYATASYSAKTMWEGSLRSSLCRSKLCRMSGNSQSIDPKAKLDLPIQFLPISG